MSRAAAAARPPRPREAPAVRRSSAAFAIGNDVVDLDDAESRLEGLHPRWMARVFTATELGRIDGGGSGGRRSRDEERRRLVWAQWAAKESAYKAAKRLDPAVVFSPRAFVATLGRLPKADGVARGRVTRGGSAFAVELRFVGACLHAVAHPAGRTAAVRRAKRASRPLVGAALVVGDPSRAVRRLARTRLATLRRVEVSRVRIAGRPPVVLLDGVPLDACVSLSHHGRFVAFAFAAIADGGVRRRAPRAA